MNVKFNYVTKLLTHGRHVRVNKVDVYSKNGEISRIGGDALLSGQGRADLINYINDGTLPEVMKGNKNSEAYRTLVEMVGNTILSTNGVEIRTIKL